MNISKFYFVFGLMAFSQSIYATEAYKGQWSGEEVVDGVTASTLTLDISQKGKVLQGQYCYVTQQGNRIDCPDKDTINLHGEVDGKSSIIYFDSSFGAKNGSARITLDDKKMEWDLLEEPKGGGFYAPEKYILIKAHAEAGFGYEKKELITNRFIITVENTCGDFASSCDNVKYHGVRKKDKKEISLTGKTALDENGKVKGFIFAEGNVIYYISYNPARLQIIEGDKLLLEQPGYWK